MDLFKDVRPEEVANAIKPVLNGVIDWQGGRTYKTNRTMVISMEVQTYNDC